MAHFHMLLLIAMLIRIIEGMQTMYVTPNNPCPGSPCLELNSYVQNESSYFLSDTLFIFLPGNHFLDSVVMIANKNNLQLIGSPILTQYPISKKVHEYGFNSYDEDSYVTYMESSTQIVCTGYNDTGFIFSNITNLTIANITFINCGVLVNFSAQIAGIHLLNIHNLVMEGVSIQNSTGYGLFGINLLGYSQIMKSSFIGNNQYVKNELNHRNAPVNFKCNGKSYANNTLYYGTGEPALRGGNVVIEYQQCGNYNETSRIDLFSIVLGLGVDASFNRDTQCDPNSYKGTGLSLLLHQSYYINITIQNSTFYRNQAAWGGNIYLLDVSANFDINIRDVFIIRSVAIVGGFYFNYRLPYGLPVLADSFLHMNNVIFECNYAESDGSSFEIDTFGPNLQNSLHIALENCTFRSDYSESSAVFIAFYPGVAVAFNHCFITDMGQTKNVAIISERAAVSARAMLTLYGCYFSNSKAFLRDTEVSITSSAFYNSQITAVSATIILNGNSTFSDSIDVLNGGAIFLSSATIIISPQSYVTFVNNSATYGGAIYIEYESYLNYSSPSNVSFINNKALLTGGAIYVVSAMPSPFYEMECFYQYNNTIDNSKLAEVYVHFEGNYAGEACNSIYGGAIDSCALDYCNKSCDSGELFGVTHHFDITESQISSDPFSIRPCDEPLCTIIMISRKVYPGEMININLVTLGQRNTISPGAVLVYTNSPISFTSVLRSTNKCESYNIPYLHRNGSIYLSTELSCNSGINNIHHIEISILVLPCPAGFVMDSLNSTCTCDPLLNQHVQSCNISDQTLSKSESAWIGYNSQKDLSVIDPCPSDYCSNASKINVFNFDSQCNYNRGNVACSQCAGNLSMTFGSSQCKPCTNVHLLLIIPLAFMGIALIIFLMVFNLTVSSGTINGVILYAFVMRLYANIFFPPSSGANAKVLEFLSIFVAWLNLDLGIETCFYNGMNSYTKIWLQFSFPLYMVALVALIIIASRWSSVLSRICRYNMIPVISTLVIMLYAKLLRVVTTIFTYATVESISKHYTRVWLFDGTLPYLGLEHAFLFTAGLIVTVFFILPYTAVMLLTPCLRKKSHWKVMCWMNKLQPFVDCYEAPFKDQYRFWTGATLLYRILFCIVFGLFRNNQPIIILLVIIVIHASMIVMVGLAIYKHWLVSLLEGFFHINIVIHSLALFFLYYYNEPNSFIPTIVCVSSAFICFLSIIIFKALNYVWKNNHFNLRQLYYARLANDEDAIEAGLNEE